jgi:hypothetical protein
MENAMRSFAAPEKKENPGEERFFLRNFDRK